MKHVEYLHDFDQIPQLKSGLFQLIEKLNLSNQITLGSSQISLTSLDGNDDWRSTWRKNLKYNERYYSTLNKTLQGTIFEKIINQYPQYYRWRLLNVKGNRTYTIHQDGVKNRRIHIPITTNDQCFLCFYDGIPTHEAINKVSHYHLEVGKVYEIDSSGYHTAVNYGDDDRWHLVGVRQD